MYNIEPYPYPVHIADPTQVDGIGPVEKGLVERLQVVICDVAVVVLWLVCYVRRAEWCQF